MCPGEPTRVLSNVELILPWNVVEACYNLERNDSTNFFATNDVEGTTSQISLCKLDDHSVKIQVTVTAFDPDAPSGEEEEEQPSTSTPRVKPSREETVIPAEEQSDIEPLSAGKRRRGRPRKSVGTSKQQPENDEELQPPVKKSGKRQNDPSMPVLESVDEEVLGPEDIDLDLIYKYGPLMKAYEEQKKKERATWTRLQDQMKKIKEGKESMVIVIKGEYQDDEIGSNQNEVLAAEHELVHVIQPVDDPQQIRVDEYSRGLDDDPSQVVLIQRPGQGAEDEFDEREAGTRKFFKSRRDATTRVAKDAEPKTPSWKSPAKPVKAIKVERDQAPSHISCKLCPRMFKDHCYLFRHVKAFHAEHPKCKDYMNEIKPQMVVQCPICDKQISNIGNINNHMKQCHPEGDVSVQCDMCDKWYKTPASLKQHIRQRHSESARKINCPQCDLRFTERRALRDHVNCVHETTQVFTCSKCWKVFLTKSRLRRHMYIHGDHRHICKQCGKGFHIKDNMNKHIRIVHERNDGKMWRCSYCSKEFLVKGNLTQHIRGIHLKQFPFTCSKCQQGFRRMKDMMVHMEKCTAEEGDNLEMFSTPPVTSRRGRGGGRPASRQAMSTPRRRTSRRKIDEEESSDEEVDFDEEDLEELGDEGAGLEKSDENSEYDDEEPYDDGDDGEVEAPHQEIVLTTNGSGDGAMEFQLEQDGMVIPIEVVIDQNEAPANQGLGEVIADGTA